MGWDLSLEGAIKLEPISALRTGFVPQEVGRIAVIRDEEGAVVALAPRDTSFYKLPEWEVMDDLQTILDMLPEGLTGTGYIEMEPDGGPAMRCALVEGELKVSYVCCTSRFDGVRIGPDPAAEGFTWGSEEQKEAHKRAEKECCGD